MVTGLLAAVLFVRWDDLADLFAARSPARPQTSVTTGRPGTPGLPVTPGLAGPDTPSRHRRSAHPDRTGG